MIVAIALTALLGMLGPVAETPAAANPPAGAAASQAPEDSKITTRVKAEFAAWQRGSLDRSSYTASANEQLNTDAVESMSENLKPLGSLRSTTSRFAYKQGTSTVYVYSVHCEKGNVKMKLGLDTTGKISAVSFEPEE